VQLFDFQKISRNSQYYLVRYVEPAGKATVSNEQPEQATDSRCRLLVTDHW